MDEFGPVQVLVVGFEGTSFNGEILPELQRLKALDIVRLVDLVVVSKDVEGEIVGVELSDLSDEQRMEFGAIAGALIGLVSNPTRRVSRREPSQAPRPPRTGCSAMRRCGPSPTRSRWAPRRPSR